jgi:hypothetical protein
MGRERSRLAGLVVVVAGVVGGGGCGGGRVPSWTQKPPPEGVNDDDRSPDPTGALSPLVDELPAAPMPRAVAAGTFHGSALDEAGHALCWGRGLGWASAPLLAAASRPTPCGRADAEYTSIEAGNYDTCAITTAGEVHCWGDGHLIAEPGSPKLQSPATAIAVSEDRACAIVGQGSVVCWGWGASTIPLPAPATHIAASGNLICVRLSSGAVSCWGDDVGHGAIDGSPKVQGAKSIAVGFNHACAIVASNTDPEANEVACWGGNYYGQLGDGTFDDRHEPVRISADILVDPIAVSARVNTTCALTASGSVYCWGWNVDGQLGNGTVGTIQQKKPGGLAPTAGDGSLPTPVSGLPYGATAISMGGYTAFATLSTGALVAWGHNNLGQIGDGSKIDRPTPVGIALH